VEIRHVEKTVNRQKGGGETDFGWRQKKKRMRKEKRFQSLRKGGENFFVSADQNLTGKGKSRRRHEERVRQKVGKAEGTTKTMPSSDQKIGRGFELLCLSNSGPVMGGA